MLPATSGKVPPFSKYWTGVGVGGGGGAEGDAATVGCTVGLTAGGADGEGEATVAPGFGEAVTAGIVAAGDVRAGLGVLTRVGAGAVVGADAGGFAVGVVNKPLHPVRATRTAAMKTPMSLYIFCLPFLNAIPSFARPDSRTATSI